MKYSDKYKYAEARDIIRDDHLLVSNKKQGCMICHHPTKFIDYLSEGYLCSEECNEAFYKIVEDQMEYDESL